MLPDDPRHGTTAGWLRHRRDGEPACDPCRHGRNRANKLLRHAHARGEKLTYTPREAITAVKGLLDQGITPSAIDRAMGHRRGGILSRCASGEIKFIRRRSYNILANLTDLDIPATARCNADLTRQRIYSLMAIGHELKDMPIPACGKWRHVDKISVGVARAVRDYYREHEGKIGPNRNTEQRARAQGHEPPFAWDDPGTLAWPTPHDIKVVRPAKKQKPRRMLTVEKYAELKEQGLGFHEAAAKLGIQPDSLQRAIERARRRQEAA